MFLNSLDWMHQLLDSKLFALIFAEFSDSVDEQQHQDMAVSAYLSILTDINSQTIQFERMRQLAPALSSPDEATNLFRSTGDGTKWSIQEPDVGWVKSTVKMATQWQHLCAVNDNLSSIRHCVELLDKMMDHVAHDDVKHIREVLERIDFLTSEFEILTLLDTPGLFELADQIHGCLPLLQVPTVHMVCEESLDLMDWLRSMPDVKTPTNMHVCFDNALHLLGTPTNKHALTHCLCTGFSGY